MRAEILSEPELEFGGASRHIDPRFGIANYGPADLNLDLGGRTVRVGLIGGAGDLDALSAWVDRCRSPIAAKDNRYPHLFPEFPGCDLDRGLCASIALTDRTSHAVSANTLKSIGELETPEALTLAVNVYVQEAIDLAERNRVDVILIARPTELKDAQPRSSGRRRPGAAKPGRTSRISSPTLTIPDTEMRYANFHDLLKARLLTLGVPIQVIRRSTYDESVAPPTGRSRQDEATRAWNLHVALYYKAGGVPWRLVRDPRDLMTLYVGISFYRHGASDTLETAVAQVFNERGDGVIVRGGAAVTRGADKQPHMTETDAHDLLADALDTYRREHKHLPARVVVHKASSFTPEEAAGLDAAAQEREVDDVNLTWVTPSDGVRAFRQGNAPPLRGTHIALDDDNSVLYTGGSIEFYSTYPGMYVPQPIGLRHRSPNGSLTHLAAETLALTKMNWNQTRLDGKLPVTLRTAAQVKQVLRFCTPGSPIATRYAHYM
jgi:hypothetical protein